MPPQTRRFVTEILEHVAPEGPDEPSLERLMPVVYDELRGIAQARLRHEPPGHTLQATALVHEAYLKLVDQTRVHWQGRTHFRAVAATAMRRILLDHARSKKRLKRGGPDRAVTLHEEIRSGGDTAWGLDELIDLNDALVGLATDSPRQARIVELRTFGGLSVAEVAEVLGVSKRTVEGEWTHAKAWLRRRLAQGAGS